MLRYYVTLLLPLSLLAQPAPDPNAKFEVASIKRCESDGKSGGLSATPGRLTARCMSVKFLIQLTYAPSPDAAVPISGGPGWIESDTYDIEAKAPDGTSGKTMQGPMLRSLLADRFGLKLHTERREAPVYDLTVSKGGSKLKPFAEGSCVPNDPPQPAPTPGQKRPIYCGSFSMGLNAGNLTLDVYKRTIPEFARQLHLDRPVTDKTDISGLFDFHLEFAVDGTTMGFFPPGFPMPQTSNNPEALSIFTAIQEQLGLKLEPSKGPVEVLVIDSAQRPSAN